MTNHREHDAAPDHADFDAAMRQRHSQAVDQISPRVHAQLQQRRHLALRGTPDAARSPRPLRWMAAACCVVVLGLVVGLQLRPSNRADAPTVGSAAVAMDAAAADDDIDAVLDQNPDFYLWLASSDADTVAME